MKKKNLFISESSVGTHYDKAIMEELNCDFLSFTFYPLPQEDAENGIIETCGMKLSNSVKLNGNDLKSKLNISYFNDIVYFISKKYGNSYIYIGFDLDEMGELMAGVLYYKLLANGIDKEKIIRIPLIDIGYDTMNIGFCQFPDKCDIETYLKAISIENKLIKLTGAGFRKNHALDLLINSNETEVENINKEGTNTITYITKNLLNETE